MSSIRPTRCHCNVKTHPSRKRCIILKSEAVRITFNAFMYSLNSMGLRAFEATPCFLTSHFITYLINSLTVADLVGLPSWRISSQGIIFRGMNELSFFFIAFSVFERANIGKVLGGGLTTPKALRLKYCRTCSGVISNKRALVNEGSVNSSERPRKYMKRSSSAKYVGFMLV